jgi:hypothetical protein
MDLFFVSSLWLGLGAVSRSQTGRCAGGLVHASLYRRQARGQAEHRHAFVAQHHRVRRRRVYRQAQGQTRVPRAEHYLYVSSRGRADAFVRHRRPRVCPHHAPAQYPPFVVYAYKHARDTHAYEHAHQQVLSLIPSRSQCVYGSTCCFLSLVRL